MKTLYYDCFSGISGDMNLAAMIDLGVPESFVIEELNKLKLNGYKINVTNSGRNGIHGKQISINITEQNQHRNLDNIVEIIEKSSLSNNVKKNSIDIFFKLAAAEAKIHNKSIDEIHFHEVGAIDSILDIVGAAICLDFLKPDIIISTPVELGSGTVKCDHGILPVPAPATIEILRNIPVRLGNQSFECTTPTGAAILASFADKFVSNYNMNIEKIGYGIGYKSSEIPNILRVYLGEEISTQCSDTSHCIIECNIDDMNPEIYEYLIDKLLSEGANDVFLTPIIMKKSRNATKLSVLSHRSLIPKITNIIFKETTTFGVRSYIIDKTELEREVIQIDTKYGKLRAKRGFLNGNHIITKPEYADCVSISNASNIPLREIYTEFENKIKELQNENRITS